MRNSSVSRKSCLATKITSSTTSNISHTNSDYYDVNQSPNNSHIPHFGGEKDYGDKDIEDFVENANYDSEEDEAELLTELRQLSRNLTTTRSTNKKLTDRQLNTVESFSAPKKSQREFEDYYQKSVNRFLQKKKNDLENKRKQIEKNESSELTYKPNLIAKQQNTRHVPIAERAELVKAKKEMEILKMKKAKEEELERQFRQLTFAPRINRNSVSPGAARKTEVSPNVKRNSQCHNENIERKQSSSVIKGSENLKKGIVAPTSKNVLSFIQAPAVEDKKKCAVTYNVPNLRSSVNKSVIKVERVLTEPCDQSDEIECFNRGISTERSRSPVGGKVNLKKSLTQDAHSKINSQRQQLSNRKTPEEQLLGKKLKEKEEPVKKSELKKHEVKRETVSGRNTSRDIRDTRETSSVEKSLCNILTKGIRKDVNRCQSAMSKRETSNSVTLLKDETEREKENIGNDEEIDIASIKQNLLSIQDNLQTLKQSFRSFQNVQPLPKSCLSFVESPKASKQNKSECTENISVLRKSSQNTQHPKQFGNILMDNKLKEDRALSVDIDSLPKNQIKIQEKQTCEPLSLNKEHVIDNDTESFGNGNMSFSAAYDHRHTDKNLPVFTNKSSISIDSRKEDSLFSWKFPIDGEGGQTDCLETSNMFSRPSSILSMQSLFERKQENQPQSLKDIAEMTLKKFRGPEKQQPIC